MGTYTVTEHAEPQALWDEAAGLLLAREQFHTIMLGALSRLRAIPPEERGGPLLVTVACDGRPVAVALRTPPRSVLLSTCVPEGALDALVAHLDRAGAELPGVNAMVADAEAFARRWVARRGGEPRTVMRLLLHACSELVPARDVPGRLRDATPDDRDLLVPWVEAFTSEALPHERQAAQPARLVDLLLAERPPGIVVWDDGGPRSMATYLVPGDGSPRLGTVYTPSDVRGHGYASACVGTLTRRLLADGHERVLLFTDLANPTSNRIYARLGYRPLGEFAEVRLGAGRPR